MVINPNECPHATSSQFNFNPIIEFAPSNPNGAVSCGYCTHVYFLEDSQGKQTTPGPAFRFCQQVGLNFMEKRLTVNVDKPCSFIPPI